MQCEHHNQGDICVTCGFGQAPTYIYSLKHLYSCPTCSGTGKVSRPSHIAGDQLMWSSSDTGPYICQSCGGMCLVLA